MNKYSNTFGCPKIEVSTRRGMYLSNIRQKNFLPFPSVRLSSSITYRPTPWIMKRGGLENSGGILISLNGKTKIIAFFFSFCIFFFFLNFSFLKKKSDFFQIFETFQIFSIFTCCYIFYGLFGFFFIFL